MRRIPAEHARNRKRIESRPTRFRCWPFQLFEANPGRLRPKERSQPLDNPGGARQRDGREFGPEMGRRRAERVNRASRARRRERDSGDGRDRRKPLRILGITRPISPPAQNKTPRSRYFATVGFKLRGPNSVRTVEKTSGNNTRFNTQVETVRNAVWVMPFLFPSSHQISWSYSYPSSCGKSMSVSGNTSCK